MRKPLRVLIIEDSEDDAELLLAELQRGGYDVEYERVETAEAMLAMLSEKEWDIILSDYTLPKFSAPQALEMLKTSELDIPFIILSGTIGEETAVSALKAGANDFLVKGKFARLKPAIERELREAEMHRDRKRAEEQISYQARLLRHINDAVIATDDQFRISAWNRAAERIYGWTAVEVIGRNVDEVLRGGLNEEQQAKAQELLKENSSFRSERIHSRKNGQLVYVEENAIALTDPRGTITGYLSVNRDITERRQAEEALRENEHLLSEAQRIGHMGSWSYNLISNLLQFSDEMYRLFDVSPREFPHTSKAFLNLIDQSDQPAAAEWLEIIRTGRQPSELTIRIFRKNGELRHILCRGALTFNSSGKPVRFTGMAQDITERKRAEEQIQLQIKRLKALRAIDIAISSSFNLSLTLGLLLDQVTAQLKTDAATVLTFNPITKTLEHAASRGFRSSAIRETKLRIGEEYAGKAILAQHIIHISNLQESGDEFGRASLLKSEDFIDYYCVPLIAKGEVKGVLEIFHRGILTGGPEWLDFLESLSGPAAIAIDNAQLFNDLQISNAELELRVAERTAELKQTNAALEHANRAKDEFLATMSHELRTPLNSILGLSETLLEQTRGPLNERQAQALQVITSSGKHLLGVINDILEVSKIEAGKLDIHADYVDIKELCQSSLMFVKESAFKKSISLEFHSDPSISTLLADPQRAKQILVNLLSNAVKFTPDGGQVMLEVSTNPERDQIRFTVTDSGIGIASEDMSKLFRPFVQLDSSLARQHLGTGLGLTIVYKLTELHGGSVQVESEVGQGSRFTIILPWNSDSRSATDTETTPTKTSVEAAQEPEQVSTRRAKILAVEDHEANLMMLSEYLQSQGFEVIPARNGLDALSKAEEIAPDLILMDIQMPSMDGLEATRRLRANPRFVSTPIIALTALAMPGDRERCLEAGATDYMSKPVSLRKLYETIKDRIGKER
jgi:PAS domain S-box-containing protein